jgi:hypothetical protein
VTEPAEDIREIPPPAPPTEAQVAAQLLRIVGVMATFVEQGTRSPAELESVVKSYVLLRGPS